MGDQRCCNVIFGIVMAQASKQAVRLEIFGVFSTAYPFMHLETDFRARSESLIFSVILGLSR
jgi:hypothetical protein